MHSIYGLADPETGIVRYVGQTKNGLRRVKAHCIPSVLENPRTPIDRWCSKLVARNLEPQLCVLEEFDDVPKELLDKAETKWIASLNTKVPNGLNLTDGGEGRPGYVHTAETKKKLCEAWEKRRQRPVAESTRKKCRDHMLGNLPGNSRSVRFDDSLVFPSAKQAARYLGVSSTQVGRLCNTSKTIHGKSLVWVREK